MWFLGALAPHAISVPTIGLFGNRYGYLALYGLATCVAALWHGAGESRDARQRVLVGVAVLALGFSAALRTGEQASHFRSNRALYAADIESDPQNGYALYHYATAVMKDSGCAEALPYFVRATELAPRYPRSWHDVAGCALSLGNATLAEPFARRAIALNPNNVGMHYNLGLALLGRGAREEALRELNVAARLNPRHEATRSLLRQIEGAAQDVPEPAAPAR